MNPRALLAELVGTFALTLTVIVSLNNPGFAVSTPTLAAVTLGVFVYMIGPVSGCHVNPSITISVFAIGRISLREALGYLVSQFAGAGLALAVGGVFFSTGIEVPTSHSLGVGFAEMFGAGMLAFSVATVVIGRVPGNLSGMVIGAGLLVGIGYAAHRSNGVLNPAVALGIGSFTHPYIWGPIVGALLGAFLASWVCDPDALWEPGM